MIKTLKWIYDLGIRHERVRIASHLQLASQQARTSNESMMDMMRDLGEKKFSKKRSERLEFNVAVNDRVQVIIQDMFQTSDTWVSGASIMFPDDEHKGKIK